MIVGSLLKQQDELCMCGDTVAQSPAAHSDLAAVIEATLGAAEQANEAET